MANATQSEVLGKFVWYDQMSNDLRRGGEILLEGRRLEP